MIGDAAERLRYTSLQKQFKTLSITEQIDLSLSTFLKNDLSETHTIFDNEMKKQTRLVKGAIEFLDEISSKSIS